MRKFFAFLTAVLIIANASLVFAQTGYGSPKMPGGLPDKQQIQKVVETIIEMGLIYKMLEQPNLVSVDNGVIVAYGNTLRKYDKDLNFVKEVDLDVNVDAMQGLANKFADKYSSQFIDMMNQGMGMAGANLMQSKLRSNDLLARATLRAISTAAESYATTNKGSYPMAMSFLTAANPPYLNTDYCASSPIAGFNYDCSGMTASGYTIVATPVLIGSTGTTTETITTGGVLTP